MTVTAASFTSETLTQPLVVPVRQGGSFARRPQEKVNVGIRK